MTTIDDFSGSRVWTAAAALEPHLYRSLWLGASYDAIQFNVSGSGPFSLTARYAG